VEHRREEKEVVTADERDFDVLAVAQPSFEPTRRLNAAKPTAEHDDSSSSHEQSSVSLDVGGSTKLQAAPGSVVVETSPAEWHRTASMTPTPRHWREYAIEGCCLGIFMISAVAFAVVLQHPRSPLAGWTPLPALARLPMGLAMGLTCTALIYSPAGRRSGAHMNPAVTLTFFRLGKISAIDAAAYMSAQFLGGTAGMCVASLVFRRFAANASVNFVSTMPGPPGSAWAFGAETAISFVMMLTVLAMSNAERLARLTGIAAGVLVAAFITLEAPLSGMSMNPARTVASALFAGGDGLWIYFAAPPLGMLAAAEAFLRIHGRARVRCAKLHHRSDVPCIFHCGYTETAA
jgi:aquaporin Z